MIEYYLVEFRKINLLKIFKKLMFIGFGLILVILGLASLVVPFSPGLVLIFLGVTYLAKGSRYIKKHKLINKVLSTIRKVVYRYKKV
jgi:uncharacterized protein YqgC (DUF456 family)